MGSLIILVCVVGHRHRGCDRGGGGRLRRRCRFSGVRLSSVRPTAARRDDQDEDGQQHGGPTHWCLLTPLHTHSLDAAEADPNRATSPEASSDRATASGTFGPTRSGRASAPSPRPRPDSTPPSGRTPTGARPSRLPPRYRAPRPSPSSWNPPQRGRATRVLDR